MKRWPLIGASCPQAYNSLQSRHTLLSQLGLTVSSHGALGYTLWGWAGLRGLAPWPAFGNQEAIHSQLQGSHLGSEGGEAVTVD